MTGRISREAHERAAAELERKARRRRKWAKRNEELRAERKRKLQEEREQKRKEWDERRKAEAAERMEREKVRARMAFIQAGGDPDDFDREWRKTIKPRLIEKGTFAAMKKPRRAADLVNF